MSKIISVIALLIFLTGCKKSAMENANEVLPTGTIVSSATFTSGSHTTSGSVKVVRDATGKIQLLFENFRTDNGPDLRVWLAPNNNASSYQEVGLLKAVSGNFSYELGAVINYTTNNRVLIWCEDFSVLFGFAVLQ